MPDNEEILEMLDYGIDMLSGELPLIELEYGWTPALQADIRDRVATLRAAVAAGEDSASPQLSAELDRAGVKQGTLRELIGLLETSVAG